MYCVHVALVCLHCILITYLDLFVQSTSDWYLASFQALAIQDIATKNTLLCVLCTYSYVSPGPGAESLCHGIWNIFLSHTRVLFLWPSM